VLKNSVPDRINQTSVDPERLLWLFTVAVTLLFSAVAIINSMTVLLKGLSEGFYVGDFVVFWTAAKAPLGSLYDFVEITRDQLPITGDRGPRPFIYPPTALPWMMPLAHLSLLPALVAWTAFGLAAYFFTAQRILSGRLLIVAMLSPMVVQSIFSGQSSLLVGALIFGGVASANRHAAGILFAIAACIKPQAALLVPIALIAARDWRALLSSAFTWSAVVALTLILWGANPWLQWAGSLAPFRDIILSSHLRFAGPTPSALIQLLDFPAGIALLAVPAGMMLVWRAFRSDCELPVRLGALVAGCLLSTPYAMTYELASLQLTAAALLMDPRAGRVAWLGAASVYANVVAPVGLMLMALALWKRSGPDAVQNGRPVAAGGGTRGSSNAAVSIVSSARRAAT
jgi:hypothetical protein